LEVYGPPASRGQRLENWPADALPSSTRRSAHAPPITGELLDAARYLRLILGEDDLRGLPSGRRRWLARPYGAADLDLCSLVQPITASHRHQGTLIWSGGPYLVLRSDRFRCPSAHVAPIAGELQDATRHLDDLVPGDDDHCGAAVGLRSEDEDAAARWLDQDQILAFGRLFGHAPISDGSVPPAGLRACRLPVELRSSNAYCAERNGDQNGANRLGYWWSAADEVCIAAQFRFAGLM
jgi:hypothetical protein